MKLYLVEWVSESEFERNILGIFSDLDRAKNAIDADKEMYPSPEYDTDYIVTPLTVDGVYDG